MSLSLGKILKSSYNQNSDEVKRQLLKKNYVMDEELSSKKQRVFYNPLTKKLLIVVRGTNDLHDFGVDAYLAAGKLKDTNRYKQAKFILEEARRRYPSAATNVDIAGHSLGGSIASRIARNKDRIYSFDKGSTFGERVRDNEKSYRAEGDVISTLAPATETIKTGRAYNPNIYGNHDTKYADNIFIGDEKESPELVYDPNAGDSVEFQNYSL